MANCVDNTKNLTTHRGIPLPNQLRPPLFLIGNVHDDVIKWKHFRVTGHLCGEFTGPRWIPAQRPVTRSFDAFLDLRRINGWVNYGEAGDWRRHRAHYDVIVMVTLNATGSDDRAWILTYCRRFSAYPPCCDDLRHVFIVDWNMV